MLKVIFRLIKRIILSLFLIYFYNKLALPFDVLIPMNFLTLILVALFGIPSIVMLILFSVIIL